MPQSDIDKPSFRNHHFIGADYVRILFARFSIRLAVLILSLVKFGSESQKLTLISKCVRVKLLLMLLVRKSHKQTIKGMK